MAEALIASLGEFAAIPGVPSEPTLRRLIKDNPDFPANPGTNGQAYEIDVAAGIAWLKERDAKRVQSEREHAERVRQLGLDLLGDSAATDVSQVGMSADERRKLLEEELYAIKVAEKRGKLIRKADIEAAISDVLVADAQRRASFMTRLAKRVSLTREQLAAAEELIDYDRRQFAAALKGLTENDDADAAGGDAAAV